MVVPSSSIAAVKFASPGLSIGFASLPVRTTRFGGHHRQPVPLVEDQRQAVGQFGRLRRRRAAADAPPPAFGGSLRHASSALSDSLPSPAFALGGGADGTCGAEVGLAGHGMHDDARAGFCSCSLANACTEAGVTAR